MLEHNCSFEPNDCENDRACVDSCEPVGHANHQSVFAYVVVHGIVAGEGNETAESQTKREEDLGSGVQPALDIQELFHLEATCGISNGVPAS